MTEKDKKDDKWISNIVDYGLIKGESVGIPTFVFLKQQMKKIKRECTIVEAFLENHIKELRLKSAALDAKGKKKKEKEEKEEEELNWKNGPHWHPDVKPKKK
jgi:hypothetical protein|tara:strand:+ start:514 stop:819 length:306 start_codon:yes stop_codon:yes gene_type:complete